MSKLKAAFVKWKIKGLTIDTTELYRIDANLRVLHSVVYDARGYRSGYSTKLHVVYKADNDGLPIKLISFNEVFDDKKLDNWMQKYDKTVSRLYDYNGM